MNFFEWFLLGIVMLCALPFIAIILAILIFYIVGLILGILGIIAGTIISIFD